MPRLEDRNLVIIEQYLSQLHLDSSGGFLVDVTVRILRCKALLILAFVPIFFRFIILLLRRGTIIVLILVSLRLFVLGIKQMRRRK